MHLTGLVIYLALSDPAARVPSLVFSLLGSRASQIDEVILSGHCFSVQSLL